jgi:hypothetical protein
MFTMIGLHMPILMNPQNASPHLCGKEMHEEWGKTISIYKLGTKPSPPPQKWP